MRRLALALGLAGLAVAVALVAREGAGAIVGALAASGAGVFWGSALHLVPMVLNARAWQLLAPAGRGRSLAFFTWLVWVREAVNALLPVARVGGEVATIRLMTARGVGAPAAMASVVADTVLALVTQGLFTAAGLVLLAGRSRGVLERVGWASLVLAAIAVGLVAAAQRLGAFEALGRAARALLGERFEGLARGGRRTDRALRAVYRGRGRVLASCAWQLAGWAAGAAEVWAFLALGGTRLSAADALALEAMVQAMSSAAFAVPGALGVQEATFVAVGSALGLPPAVALGAALFRRARDLLVFVPALVAWQAVEGRRLIGAEAAGERTRG